MKLRFLTALFATMCISGIANAQESKRPTVVELFTAQGCPSCPRADAMLKEISEYPGYFPLSFHVTYFDGQGRKDPYSSKDNNLRQRRYLMAVGMQEAFTPHFVVDGTISSAGGDAASLAKAIKQAQSVALQFPLTLKPNESGDGLNVTVGDDKNPLPADAVLYEVHFKSSTVMPIRAGNNAGITSENVNNVLSFFKVPLSTQYYVPMSRVTGDGLAYLLHNREGRIMGAAYYVKPLN